MYKVFACAAYQGSLGGAPWQSWYLAVHSLNLFSRVRSAAKESMRLVPASSVLNIDSCGCASLHVLSVLVCVTTLASLRAAKNRLQLQLGTLSVSAP